MQHNYLHNCWIVLCVSISINVTSFSPTSAGRETRDFRPLSLCPDSVTLVLLISPLFLWRVSEIIGQAVHGQPAHCLKPNSLLIKAAYIRRAFLYLQNVLMSIISSNLHKISKKKTKKQLLSSAHSTRSR